MADTAYLKLQYPTSYSTLIQYMNLTATIWPFVISMSIMTNDWVQRNLCFQHLTMH